MTSIAASPRPYDAIIIGSGQAGNPLAAALSAAGKRTALIERAAVGGTCVNYGCTPTKAMVASAEVAYLARRAKDYGVTIDHVGVDMSAVRDRKRGIVNIWRTGSEKRIANSRNVDLLRGEASFTGPRQLHVRLNDGGELSVTSEIIVIDTGLSANPPPIPGLASVPFLDNVSIMELDTVPDHLLVLGGGYIGLEFAQMFRRFGSRVTIIHNASQLLPNEDADIATEIAKILREDGIEILLEAETQSASGTTGEIELSVGIAGHSRKVTGSHLLVATGRKPNTDALNLHAAGVATTPHGFITVDDRLRTNVPGIYAVGDVNGGPAFTHIAYDDFRILKANLLESGNCSTTSRLIPYCVFIDPQLGRIGLSEKQAAAQGRKVRIARLPMTSVARAMETSQTQGFMKALVDPETHQILGAAILGKDGGEIMSMIQIAMMGKLKYTTLQAAVFAHPAYAESLNNLFSNIKDN
jgi:pyruvate/2-oxoglutarate dehydrogenase complex dihydrolipoamide dehydrogenase (E3) component